MQFTSDYGLKTFGRLKKVMVHCPYESLKLINSGNYQYYLFDYVPDIDKYIAEHMTYRKLLESYGVEVLELAEYVIKNKELMYKLPNLPYLNDSSVITSKGGILSKMKFPGRKGEDTVVKEALTNLGIPIWHTFDEEDEFEGCLILSPETILIADTERHKQKSIDNFISKALELFKEIIYIKLPQERRFMHPDMIFGQINNNLALVYLPAVRHTYHITKNSRDEVNFRKLMKSKEVELVELSDEEQQKWGSSFIPLEPNVIINYDISLSKDTQETLSSKGVKMISLHPEALLAGGGSLRCLTLQIYRE